MVTPAEANALRVEDQSQRAVDQMLRARRFAAARSAGGPGDRGAAERTFASAAPAAVSPVTSAPRLTDAVPALASDPSFRETNFDLFSQLRSNRASADRLDAEAMAFLMPDYVAGPGLPGPAYPSEQAASPAPDSFSSPAFRGSGLETFGTMRSNAAAADRLNSQADFFAEQERVARANQAASDRLNAAAASDGGAPIVTTDTRPRPNAAADRYAGLAGQYGVDVNATSADSGARAAYQNMQAQNTLRAAGLQDQMIADLNESMAGMDLSGLDFSAVGGPAPDGAGGVDVTGGGTGAGGNDGGGAGGGGGGAGGGAPNWATILEQQRQAAVAMRARLENEYQARRSELTSMFNFAETDEERAQIAFLMAELQDATDIAYDAITSGYQQATETAILLGDRARRMGDVEGAEIENLFLQAGQRIGDITGQTVAESGIGAGLVGQQALQGSNDFMQLVAADAAREAALSRRLGGITAEDFQMFQGRLGAQSAAQQAALARESRAAGTSLQAQHAAAVAQRIAEDRRRLVQELQQLQSQYGELGYNYDAQTLGTYGTAAALSQRDAQAAADRAASLQAQRDRAAFEQQQILDQRAYEESQRPEWQTDELAAALLRIDLATDAQRATPGFIEGILGGLLPGMEAVDAAALRAQEEAELRMGQSNRPPLVELTDAQILERARELEEEEAAARRANADRIRAETAARILEGSGYSNYMRNP